MPNNNIKGGECKVVLAPLCVHTIIQEPVQIKQ